MSYEMKFDKDDNIVNVTYSGSATLGERKKVVDEVSSLYSHIRSLAVLIDVRKFKMDLTMTEQQLLGKYLANHSKLTNVRVAVLHNEGYKQNLFVDTSAFLEGHKRARFTKYKDARNWLKEE